MNVPLVTGDTFELSLSTESALRTLIVLLADDQKGRFSEARTAEGVPQLRDPHPDAPALIVSEVTVAPLRVGVLDEAKVTVRYMHRDKLNLGESVDRDFTAAIRPWERPALWQISSLKKESETDRYYPDFPQESDPLPNTNSAGDLLYPPVVISESVRLFTFHVALPFTAKPAFLDTLIGTVNRNELTLLGRHGSRCFYFEEADYSLKYWFDSEIRTDIPYFNLTLMIQYYPEGFTLEQIDMGSRQIRNGQLEPILDPNENPVVEPVKLNGKGVAYDWSVQPDPRIFTTLPARRFYRDEIWNIPFLPSSETFR